MLVNFIGKYWFDTVKLINFKVLKRYVKYNALSIINKWKVILCNTRLKCHLLLFN